MRILQIFPVIAWLCGCLAAGQSFAQPDDVAAKVQRHMPNETIAFVSLWPQQLSQKPRMELAPLEVISAAGLEQIGLDPLKLTRVDVMIAMPGPAGVQFGALLHGSEPLPIENANPQVLVSGELENEKGFEFLALSAPEPMVLHQLDENTVVLGTKIFAKQMVAKRDQSSELAKVAGTTGMGQDAMAVVAIETLRPLLIGGLQSMRDAQFPMELKQEVMRLCEVTQFMAVRIMLDDTEKLQLVLSAANEGDAETLNQTALNALDIARDLFVAEGKRGVQTDTQTGVAIHAYLERIGKAIVKRVTPERRGNRIAMEFSDPNNIAIIGTLTGLLLPAVQSARVAAGRMQTSNNLKQLALAMFNFESAYRAFPATAGVDDEGKPMLSWRVAVLPFLEEQQLYERFNLDEPWDSENNLALLEEMPDVFKHPTKATKPGHTVYLAAVGEDTYLQRTEATQIREITDGTSNTIMLVEVQEEAAVPWTAPQDFEVDMEKLTVEDLFGPEAETTTIGMGDGSVRTFARSIDLEVLKALFTRSGGEVVNVP